MREIHRIIASALIFSKDGKLLMGMKDSRLGGVFNDCWHIPGGGVESGETFEAALLREVKEEVGIDISPYPRVAIKSVGKGESEKTLRDTGEVVWCKMDFHRFEIHINDLNASEIKVVPSDDLVNLMWFSKEELSNVKQMPGAKEFFQEMGYI